MPLDSLLQLLFAYKYFIILPMVFIFGAPVGLAAGVLLRLGVLELLPTCLLLAAGELAADVWWYWLGMRYGEPFSQRFGKYIGLTETSLLYTKKLFEKRHGLIIFTSKITAGLGFGSVVMFTAGLVRIPFRRYMMFNITGQTLWTAALLSTGYFLSHLFVQISGTFNNLTSFAIVTVIVLCLVGLGRYLRSRFTIVP